MQFHFRKIEMQTPGLLHQFSHFVPFAAKKVSLFPHQESRHLPLVLLAVDFENGDLLLKADLEYLKAFSPSKEKVQERLLGKRVLVEANIFPKVIIDIENQQSNGLVLGIKGSISDGINILDCTGMLMLQKQNSGKQTLYGDWMMSLFLYERMEETREMRYRFPLFIGNKNVQNN